MAPPIRESSVTGKKIILERRIIIPTIILERLIRLSRIITGNFIRLKDIKQSVKSEETKKEHHL